MATEGYGLPAPQSRRERQLLATQQLLDQADELLASVDNSDFMADKKPREYPRFDRNEIRTGSLLGVGGFGIVFEVKGFSLNVPREVAIQSSVHTWEDSQHETEEKTQIGAEDEARTPPTSGSDLAHGAATPINTSDESDTTATTTAGNGDDMDQSAWRLAAVSPLDEAHYDVMNARQYMCENFKRNGDARYAIKRLHRDLNDLERVRGMIDLAIEAKFLSTIWHPNIVKMRGMASGPLLNTNFFIIMDRLYETLEQKMKDWVKADAKYRRLFGLRKKQPALSNLLEERMIVAYDLAAACWYLHDNKIVYRDIKQQNIGFDVRGDVKLFDFGLCKGLSPSLRNKEGPGYLLTPRTGSVPYMAPEVAECKPYDCQCDVFSFSILVWEMLSLRTAFKGYGRREFLERVVRKRERLIINRDWPPLTRLMIKEAWDNDPAKRPSMKRVAVLLRGDLNEMTCDTKVKDRTQHMKERSAHSLRFRRGLNRKKSDGYC